MRRRAGGAAGREKAVHRRCSHEGSKEMNPGDRCARPGDARQGRTGCLTGRGRRRRADRDSWDRCLRARRCACSGDGASVAPGRTHRPASRHRRRPGPLGRRNNAPDADAAASSSPRLATPAVAGGARAQKPAERGGPLRLGVDRALVESGLARSLQHAFGADTGIAVLLVPGPALAVLEAAKRRRGRRRARQRPGGRGRARAAGPGARPPADRRGRVHPRRAGAGEASRGRLPPPVQERRRGARADPRPGRCRPGEPRLPVRRRRLRRRTSPSRRSGGRRGSSRSRRGTSPPSRGAGFIAQVRARGAYALVERGAWTAARRRAARRPRRGRSAARRIGARDALVPGQPSGRQDLHRLDRRRPRPRRGRHARAATAAALRRARWPDPAGC